jgi:hypothetical protein
METIAERRRRKLIDLAEANGGLARLAATCDLSAASLDQVIKRTPMSRAKQDGTKSVKALGDASARKIEDSLQLARGWFDADDAAPQSQAPTTPLEPDEIAGALRVLAEALQGADKVTRSAVAHSFSILASEPEQLENVTDTVKKLVSAPVQVARGSHDVQTAGTTIRGLGTGKLLNEQRIPLHAARPGKK